MPQLSIVIVTYNCRDLLAGCLDSVGKQLRGKVDYEILVVDSGSTDLFPEDPLLADPAIRFRKLDYNAGFPGGNNIAFADARGDFILMLNPDTLLLDEGLPEMMSLLRLREDIGIISPRILNPDGSLQESVQDLPRFWNSIAAIFAIGRRRKTPGRAIGPVPVDSTTGAYMLFRASLLRDIGQLDEGLFWIEDMDFCYRAGQAGKKTYYDPRSEIIHFGGQSARKNRNLALSLQLTNRPRYFFRRGKPTIARILYLVTLLSLAARYVAYSLAFIFDWDARRLATLGVVSRSLLRERRLYLVGGQRPFARNHSTSKGTAA
jgi:GT2 family glycosyltransferase